MEPAKLWNIFKAKAVGRSGIAQAFQEGCILLCFPTHLLDIFFLSIELSVLAPILAQTALDPSPGMGIARRLFLRQGVDSRVNASNVRGWAWPKEPSVKPWLLSSPWFFYFEHWMTTIRGLWKGEQYLHKEAALQNRLLVSSRPVFKFYLHYVWQEFRWVTLSPRFNFFLYQLPPSWCWETDWACACPPSAPLYLVGLALLSHEILV